MYELFFQVLQNKAAFSQEDLTTIQQYLTPKKLRKKQYLLQEGDVCKHVAFVEKGVLRSYSIDEAGKERIIQFALEGWLISDLFSFLTTEPATYTIDAVENCELVLISKQAHEKLLSILPRYETWVRLEITGAYLALQRRLNAVISLTLEERYAGFTSLYPEIAQRVPQHMIAAYMGLTPETLSRVRKKITTRK